MKKKIMALTLASSLCMQSVGILAASQDDINKNNDKINQLQSQNKNLEEQKKLIQLDINELLIEIATKQKEINKLQSEIDSLQNDIDALQIQINDTLELIKETEDKIAKIEEDIRVKEAEQDSQENILKDRLKRSYINNSTSEILAIILDSSSVSEALFKAKYISDVIDMDKQAIEKLKQIQEELNVAKNACNEEKVKLNEHKSSLETNQNIIKAKQDNIVTQQDFLEAEFDELAKLESEKKSKIKNINVAISDNAKEIYDLNKENDRIKSEMEALQNPNNPNNSNSSSNQAGAISFIKPASGTYTSPYGPRIHPITGKNSFHTGIDIANGYGTPIKATAAGTVVKVAKLDGAWGNRIVIKHNNTYSSMYAHLDTFKVSVGDKVSQGQVIGYMGSTGYSTGPHLHFEIWKNGSHVNPRNFI